MSTTVAPEIARMSEPNPAPGLFERVAPAIARMSRDAPQTISYGGTSASPRAQQLAYLELAKHFADAGLRGLAGWYTERARELEP